MPSIAGTMSIDHFDSGFSSYDVIYGLDGADLIEGWYSPGDPNNTIFGGPALYSSMRFMIIEGGQGSDVISFTGSYSVYYHVRGFVLTGTASAFGRIDGGGGDDTIRGGNGSDTLLGGDGNDSISGGDNAFPFGSDWIDGGRGNDTLVSGISGDQLYDGEGNDICFGNGGNDTFVSGTGNDTLIGGEGDDVIWAMFDTDLLIGDGGHDIIAWGSHGNGQGYGGAGNDNMVGNGAANYMQGDDGNDLLFGLQGADTLNGGAGNDGLSGGDGADFMLGGQGQDGFYFTDGGIEIGQYDQVGDFQDGVDFIFMSAAYQGSLRFADTNLGALAWLQLGASSWGVYFSGATVAQIQDQFIYV